MSRIEESLYNSVSKYGVKLNESLDTSEYKLQDFEKEVPYSMRAKAFDVVEDDKILYWVTYEYFDDQELAEFKKTLEDYNSTENWGLEQAFIIPKAESVSYDYNQDIEMAEDDGYWIILDGMNESCDLTEAVNPENEEVNAIIKKYLGKKGVPNKKEQAVLDKYGIKKDEYGRFVGPKGATLYGDRTSVMGPSKPGRTTRTRWGKYRSNSEPFGWFDKSKTGGKYKNPKDVDALDKIDYANYLTKVDPDEPRGKNKEWSVDAENEYSMKPYSEPYKDAKKDAKYERRRQQTEIDDILADKKEIERRQRSIERSKENAKKHAENAAKAEQDRKDILAKARAKHGKTNESLRRKMNEKLDDDTYDDFEVEMAEAVTDIMEKYGASAAEVKQAFKTIQNVYL